MRCFWLLFWFGVILYDAVPLVIDGHIAKSIINDAFEDGTKADQVLVLQEANKAYLVRIGIDTEKNCHLSRTELVDVQIGETQTYMMPIGGITETCTGVHCSQCAFKDGGGCECKSILGHCDHTISKNWNMLRFLP